MRFLDAESLNNDIQDGIQTAGLDANLISDGYHTFGELYEHRIVLWIALCKQIWERTGEYVWKTKVHSDGTSFDGWFVLGLSYGSQITYHLPMKYWEEIDFGEELERAPEFDGHTSADVLERLKGI